MSGFQVMPRLNSEEYEQLEQDIIANGVQVPIVVAADGRIVDGHHRDEIARKHDKHCPRTTASGSEAELRSMAFRLNINRRHFTREQKRELIAESLKADPQLSNREHGRRTGADHKTVDAMRKPLEEGGEIPHLEHRENPQGRKQPASKPTPAPPAPSPESCDELEDGKQYSRPEPKPQRSSPARSMAQNLEDALFGLKLALGLGDPQKELSQKQRQLLLTELENIITNIKEG